MSGRRRVRAGALPSLGPGLLAAALADLSAGVLEYGPRVQAMLATVGISGHADWNGAALTTWLTEAAAAGKQRMPIPGSSSGDAIVAQFISSSRWIPRASLTAANIVPGMIACRGAAGSVLVGVVVSVELATGRIHCIDGDAGEGKDRVAPRNRLLSDPLFLGCGSV